MWYSSLPVFQKFLLPSSSESLTAEHLRRESLSFSPPCEPQISPPLCSAVLADFLIFPQYLQVNAGVEF
jgi:hypothetical protein